MGFGSLCLGCSGRFRGRNNVVVRRRVVSPVLLLKFFDGLYFSFSILEERLKFFINGRHSSRVFPSASGLETSSFQHDLHFVAREASRSEIASDNPCGC